MINCASAHCKLFCMKRMDTLSTGIPFYNSGVRDIRFDVLFRANFEKRNNTREKKSDSSPQIYSTYVLLTQIAGQQLHVEAGLLLCAAGQELIPLAGKHSLPPLIATSFWSFVAKLFIVHSF